MKKLIVLALLSGCIGEIQGPVSRPIQQDYSIWVENHPDLDVGTILSGANAWAPVGVRFTLAPRTASNFQVVTDNTPCIEGAEKNPPAAHAFPDGKVALYINSCNGRGEDGRIERSWLKNLISHEFGHQLGVWDHIPIECNDPKVTYKFVNGRKICGRAIMNSFPNWPELNDLDFAAYVEANQQ